MKPRRNCPRGFATIMALISISLVGVTTAALVTQAAMQARRNTREIDRAQQQQILIAQSLAQPGESVVLPPTMAK